MHVNASGKLTGTAAWQGAGGAAYGGGVYVGGGKVTLSYDGVQSNAANGGTSAWGTGAKSTMDSGGGLYIAGGLVTYGTSTIINNTDSNNDGNANVG